MKIECKQKEKEQEPNSVLDYFLPLIAMVVLYGIVWILGTIGL